MLFDEMDYDTHQAWSEANEDYWRCVKLEKQTKWFLRLARAIVLIFFFGGLAFIFNRMWWSGGIWIGCAAYWQLSIIPRNVKTLSLARELIVGWETVRDEWNLPAFRKDYR